jgi:hypothetical protein
MALDKSALLELTEALSLDPPVGLGERGRSEVI